MGADGGHAKWLPNGGREAHRKRAGQGATGPKPGQQLWCGSQGFGDIRLLAFGVLNDELATLNVRPLRTGITSRRETNSAAPDCTLI